MARKTAPSRRDEKILSDALDELSRLGVDGEKEAQELGHAYGAASYSGISFGEYENHLFRVRRAIADYGKRVDFAVCQRCYLTLEGYDAHELGLTEDDPRPLSLIGETPDGFLYGSDDAPYFSHSDCEGCGRIAGDRHRITLMPR